MCGEPGSELCVAAVTSCSLRSARILFGLTLFFQLGWLLKALSGKPNSGTRPGKRILKYCCFCGGHSCVRSVDLGFVGWGGVAGWFIHVGLFSGRAWGGQVEMKKMMWRYGLTEDRCRAMQWRCRGEGLRCVATRRLTSRTGGVSGSANREKTGCFAVKIWNRWSMFQCTVNWSRARLS